MSIAARCSDTPAVLLAHDDPFEAGYLQAVLAARGHLVLLLLAGAEPLAPDALAGVAAAVLTHRPEHQAPCGLLPRLEEAGVPYLVLARSTDRVAATARAVLVRPFAGYQVADWVGAALPAASRR